jgi:hypothetical protein
MRFEAYTRPQIVEYMKRFKTQLDRYPQVDQQKFVTQIEAMSD